MSQRLRTYKRVSSARDEERWQAYTGKRKTVTDEFRGRLRSSSVRSASPACGGCGRDFNRPNSRRNCHQFSEKARVSPEKLGVFVSTREGALFSPTGVLRLDLNDDAADDILRVARDALLEVHLEV